MNVAYEDNHCVAVVKPHGTPTQGDKTGDPSLMDDVKAFIKERDKKPGDVFLGLVHRLDRPVGGVVLFAKTSKGASRLSEQFRTRGVEKTYLAVVEGRPAKDEGTVRQWLVKDKRTNRAHAVPEGTRDAKEAVLDWRVVGSGNGRTLIEINPKTGRSHQIRIAMATLGTPIVYDTKYGAGAGGRGAIALFANRLSFDQPVSGERITAEATPTLECYREFIGR